MIVHLSFNDRFELPLLSGQKTATTRYRFSGRVGDTFEYFGATFAIEKVSRCYLSRVAEFSYRSEGFRTREEFIAYWDLIHPNRQYLPNRLVYHIRFFREK